MALNDTQKEQLAVLLEKASNTDLRGRVWRALVQIFPTVPIELIILDDQGRAFLVYRHDDEFTGWHHPGSTWNDWETIPERRAKLVAGEIVKGAGLIGITEPKSIGWMGIYRGKGPGTNPTRHECSLVHLSHFHGTWEPREGMGFFPLDNLPADTLEHHRLILGRVKQFLVDGIPLHD